MSAKNKILVSILFVLLCVVAWLFYRSMPASEGDMRASACLVNGHVTLCLVSGKDTVSLATDTVSQQGVWVNAHWWWPSCNGRILTIMPRSHVSVYAKGDSLRRLVAIQADSLTRLLDRKEIERKELQYYLRSHGVIDEGYTQIADYAAKQQRETKTLKADMRSLRKIVADDSVAMAKGRATAMRLVLRTTCRVSWYKGDSLLSVACRPLYTTPQPASPTAATSSKGPSKPMPVILHTKRHTKPWGTYAVRNVPWGGPEHRKVVTVTLNPLAISNQQASQSKQAVIQSGQVESQDKQAKNQGKQSEKQGGQSSKEALSSSTLEPQILVKGNYWRGHNHDLPRLFAPDGAAVFTVHGRFLGIIAGKEVLQ